MDQQSVVGTRRREKTTEEQHRAERSGQDEAELHG